MADSNENTTFGVGSKGKGEVILWQDGAETTVKAKDGRITELADTTPDLSKSGNRQLALSVSNEFYGALKDYAATLPGAVVARTDPTTGQPRQEVRKDVMYGAVRTAVSTLVGFQGVDWHEIARGFAASGGPKKRDVLRETAKGIFAYAKNASAFMPADQAKLIAFSSVKEMLTGEAGVTVTDEALEALWAEAMGLTPAPAPEPEPAPVG